MKSSKLDQFCRIPRASLTTDEALDLAFQSAPPAEESNENSNTQNDKPVEMYLSCTPPPNSAPIPQEGKFTQWACESNGVFRPTFRTKPTLPAGTYRMDHSDRGIYITTLNLQTDSLIILDDTASQRVVAGIRKFWDSRASYLHYGLTYKRGVLLFGPAGSGKTGTVMLLAQELVLLGGLVIFVGDPHLAGAGLTMLRTIEPDRPIILVFEDIDELIKQFNEHAILALLDGEFQINNVVSIATTNYPERLGPRIINRPSRFDERIFVDTPNEEARQRYLRHITRDEPPTEEELARWIRDSANFSIAHLREMVVAVRCLGQEYDEVVARLKSMQKDVKALPDYPRGAGSGGFSGGSGGSGGSSNASGSTFGSPGGWRS